MAARVLVLSAGAGAASNLIRGLQAADGVEVLGAHADRFTLKKSPAARNYLVPRLDDPAFAAALLAILDKEAADLVLPGSDDDVRVLSDLRVALGRRAFLPAPHVIATCQDKYRATLELRRHGVPAPRTEPVVDLDGIDAIVAGFGTPRRLWCRPRTGSGSRGAIPVARAAQARAWIEYWAEMRGVPVESFTISEYLPGRDFAAQALWLEGRQVLVKLCERLSYFGGGSQPSGTSSTPALARTVVEPGVVDVCARAIRALDPRATGVFSIDLKEDAGGVPNVTEINAGRFCMITSLFDATGRHSMAATCVRLALGQTVEIPDPFDAVEDHYLVRDLDTLPGIYHADELFEGIEEAPEAVNPHPRRR
jgi:glutathione synthase/RimK-type ligase-like ATP-grasp enzyme